MEVTRFGAAERLHDLNLYAVHTTDARGDFCGERGTIGTSQRVNRNSGLLVGGRLVFSHPEFPLAATGAKSDKKEDKSRRGPNPDRDPAPGGERSGNRRNELVSGFGKRLDKRRVTGHSSKCLAQLKDMLREVVLFDVDVRPDQFPQFLFIDRTTRPLNQSKQQIELFGGESQGLAAPEEGTGLRLQRELVELVNRLHKNTSISQVFETIEI